MGRQHYMQYQRRNEVMPMAVITGYDPTVLICASTRTPPNIDEFQVAGEAETVRLRAVARQQGFEEGRGPDQLHPQTKDIELDWIPTEEEAQPHITVFRPPGW